jgi:hypothetical protein
VAGFDVVAQPTDVRRHIGYMEEAEALCARIGQRSYADSVGEALFGGG